MGIIYGNYNGCMIICTWLEAMFNVKIWDLTKRLILISQTISIYNIWHDKCIDGKTTHFETPSLFETPYHFNQGAWVWIDESNGRSKKLWITLEDFIWKDLNVTHFMKRSKQIAYSNEEELWN